ncbi:MAG: sigma-70 family RNA polymerase sigma factor [Eubacterium sp.]|jgi:RNA polymerase primary sigma factor|nr:sigma-70 family RNA polymerase sigma factor [Eubacterium sp.]
MGNGNRTKAYQQLVGLAEKQGYLLFDDLLNSSDQWALPLQDVDWLSNSIATRGILIYDKAPDAQVTEIDDDYRDFAQIDYDEVFQKVIMIDPLLENFITYVRNIKPPQAREMDQLKYLVQEGNPVARKRVCEMYLRVAVRIALNTVEQFDCDMDETLQNACLGLLKAVDNYDPDSGDPFGTYATLTITSNVRRRIPNQRPSIYYTAKMKESYLMVYPVLKEYGYWGEEWSCTDMQDISQLLACALESDMEQSLFYDLWKVDGWYHGKDWNFDGLQDFIKLVVKALEIDDECQYQFLYMIEQIILPIIEQFTPIESLQEKYDEFLKNIDTYETHTYIQGINLEECFYKDDLFEQVSEDALSDAIDNVLEGFTEREQIVIRGWYALGYGGKKTFKDLGSQLGLSRGRIGQIKDKALKKLQEPSNKRRLLPYYL